MSYARTVVIENPVFATAIHFVYAYYCKMRYISLLDVAEFMLEFFFGRIDQQLGVLAKYNFTNLDESSHLGLTDLVRIELINLVVIMELDTEGGFF